MRAPICLTLLLALPAACTAPGGPYPSLQPRAAEMIDPRVPVERPINDRPVSAGLVAQLRMLIDQARGGTAEFDAAADVAERAAANAGAAHSEGWISAQEALSGAIAADKPAATALADVDALAATALQTQGGIAPNDLAAIQAASDEIGSIARRQRARVTAIQRQLGL
jgi:hypothetical protein